jgi:hypothetical protein
MRDLPFIPGLSFNAINVSIRLDSEKSDDSLLSNGDSFNDSDNLFINVRNVMAGGSNEPFFLVLSLNAFMINASSSSFKSKSTILFD